jgi:hypothetical protein
VKNLSGDLEYMSHSYGSLSAERRDSSSSSNERGYREVDGFNDEEGSAAFYGAHGSGGSLSRE